MVWPSHVGCMKSADVWGKTRCSNSFDRLNCFGCVDGTHIFHVCSNIHNMQVWWMRILINLSLHLHIWFSTSTNNISCLVADLGLRNYGLGDAVRWTLSRALRHMISRDSDGCNICTTVFLLPVIMCLQNWAIVAGLLCCESSLSVSFALLLWGTSFGTSRYLVLL